MTRWIYAAVCALALPLTFAQDGPSRTVSEDSEPAFEVVQRRAAATELSTGTYMQSGSISSTLRWQSSGELTANSCPSLGGTMTIRNCYQMYLDRRGMLQSTTSSSSSSSKRLSRRWSLEDQAAADDTKLDLYYRVFPEQAKYRWLASPMVMVGGLYRRQAASCPSDNTTTTSPGGPTQTPSVSPRQRIEMLTWPGTKPAEVWSYTWKSYQSSDTKGTYNFFHAWQILRRDGCGGPVISQDYINDKVLITDNVRGCKGCTSYPLKNWIGKTIVHTMTVKYGLSGSIVYQAVDASNRKVPLIKYSVAKGDMGTGASLKFGMYRAVNSQLRQATAWYGEFKATKLSG